VVESATVALVLAGAGVLYLLSLRLWPFARCRKCKGSGKSEAVFFSGRTGNFGSCRRCKGTGRKLRLGVRIGLGGDRST
jgi:hypothetical protein